MTTARVCWYLCGLFAIMVLINSAMTVHPDLGGRMPAVMAAEAVASVVFGALAVASGRTAFLRRRSVTWTFACVALLVTLISCLMVFG